MDDYIPIQFEWHTLEQWSEPSSQVIALLTEVDIDYDDSLDFLLTVYSGNQLVSCAGLAGSTIRCVAVSPQWQGENLAVRVLNEVENFAHEQGRAHLFLYTKPENRDIFGQCGFYPLVEAPNQALLMENTPVGIQRYCQKLELSRHESGEQGAIVMNANPFTLGHRYLVEQALNCCGWLHVFVVSEDVSTFPYRQRLAMVQDGVADLPRVTVHAGGEYLISRATFPSYFIKESQQVEHAYAAIDLLLFRCFIGPALGITRRFVGTEPYCPVTAAYNAQMYYWLANRAVTSSPVIDVVEIPRVCGSKGKPISASAVRQLLRQQNFQQVHRLVPKTTLSVIQHHVEPLSV